jgi:hypothetical protein
MNDSQPNGPGFSLHLPLDHPVRGRQYTTEPTRYPV